MKSVNVVPNIIRALGTIPKRMEEYLRNINAGIELACSRLSDSGEDAKEQGTRKVGGAGKRKKFPAGLFSCLRFLNSADPTISEPGTGHHIP